MVNGITTEQFNVLEKGFESQSANQISQNCSHSGFSQSIALGHRHLSLPVSRVLRLPALVALPKSRLQKIPACVRSGKTASLIRGLQTFRAMSSRGMPLSHLPACRLA